MTDRVYVVRLMDCQAGPRGLSDDDRTAAQALLRSWFDAVCAAAGGRRDRWTLDLAWQAAPAGTTAGSDAGSPATVNMILFFVPSTHHSVIRLHANWQNDTLEPEADTTMQGYTVFTHRPPGARPGARRGVLAISEIYTNRCTRSRSADTRIELARTAFHESMHNQLLLAGDELHHHGGMGAAAATATSPSPHDTALMGAAIAQLVPQWVQGHAAWRRAYLLEGL